MKTTIISIFMLIITFLTSTLTFAFNFQKLGRTNAMTMKKKFPVPNQANITMVRIAITQ